MSTIPYAPTAQSLSEKFKLCLKNHDADADDKTLLAEAVREYEAAVESGWVDWEHEFGRYIPMLRRWLQEAPEIAVPNGER